MKKLFKVIAFSFVILLGMGTMNAQTLKQNQDSPEVIAKKNTEKLSVALNLSGDQQRAVYRALVVKESNYSKDVNGKDAKSPEVAAAKKKHDEVFEVSMKKALNDEQFKKWQGMKEQ
jgi:N-acetylmuramoyl-L-alanine amidase CwlA